MFCFLVFVLAVSMYVMKRFFCVKISYTYQPQVVPIVEIYHIHKLIKRFVFYRKTIIYNFILILTIYLLLHIKNRRIIIWSLCLLYQFPYLLFLVSLQQMEQRIRLLPKISIPLYDLFGTCIAAEVKKICNLRFL